MLSEDDKREILNMIGEEVQKYPGEYSFVPGSIKSRHIKSIRWDQGQGGSLTLGGVDNVAGALYIEDSNGVVVITEDKDGIVVGTGTYKITIDGATSQIKIGTTSLVIDGANRRIVANDGSYNRIVIDGASGAMKVSRSGYDVLTTGAVNLAFDSSKSTIREVQMQTNTEQRFTDQATYQEYNDCQIQLDFSDWVDHSMFFEAVMKTGAGTGYMRLYNITDSSQLVEISTTSTTTVSVRSSAINKSALTGVKNFREEQKIVDGGAAYTDIYIGRVIMRFVYA